MPHTQRMLPEGKIYRLGADGTAVLVTSGLHNPNGVRFAHGQPWVSDINSDFIAGHREPSWKHGMVLCRARNRSSVLP